MSKKTVSYPELGNVEFIKRKGQRTIRISIKTGIVRVSMPYYTPNLVAVRFLESRIDWVKENLGHKEQIVNGMHIGKSFTLAIVDSTSNRSKIKDNTITASGTNQHIRRSIVRALKQEAETLISQRLSVLAGATKLGYASVTFKHMTGRWGSCTNKQHLTFNVLLVQLEWRLIDYVIIHELCHTIEMNHSKKFWELVGQHCPYYKELRKELRTHAPVIYNTAYANK